MKWKTKLMLALAVLAASCTQVDPLEAQIQAKYRS